MPAERWYNSQQVVKGGKLYQQFCAECHKPDASGTTNWQQLDEKGNYPPPPPPQWYGAYLAPSAFSLEKDSEVRRHTPGRYHAGIW
ncbi:MAG: cytochrome c [Candidatus Thiodiazotropha sp.]